MSDYKATVEETKRGFHVEGYEKIEYDFTFVDGIFDIAKPNLAECYVKWGRVLAVMDRQVYAIYGSKIEEYFDYFNIKLKVHQTSIGETAKTMDTFLGIVDKMNEVGIIRKEPVLIVGGGLATDVGGFACAAYRRNTPFIRVPTTLIGLVDAAVSIKVAINHGRLKNRLGAYHAPAITFLDWNFLRTLPSAQIRNGFAELIKISSCSHLQVFDLLDKYCEHLIESKFGQTDGPQSEIRKAADVITYESIYEMLKLESPNLHEIRLDRVIAYGHTWSPMHELIPETPLRHGHAISIDMAYSATLARKRGLLSEKDHRRLLELFSRAGLSIDHPQFDNDVIEKGTVAILKTRDGLLRLAVPSPLGSCTFLNEVSIQELKEALATHKAIAKTFPREGLGIETYVDGSDMGYIDFETESLNIEKAAEKARGVPTTSLKDPELKGHIMSRNGLSGANASDLCSADIQDGAVNGPPNGIKAQA
ncbi:Dehydroquinate synthase-like protein [Daldinia eschscholtzii]|nr:Dehydroquinate synthase-like protein [Daldinia eschscholtzii]